MGWDAPATLQVPRSRFPTRLGSAALRVSGAEPEPKAAASGKTGSILTWTAFRKELRPEKAAQPAGVAAWQRDSTGLGHGPAAAGRLSQRSSFAASRREPRQLCASCACFAHAGRV